MKIYENDEMLIVFAGDAPIAYIFDKKDGTSATQVKRNLLKIIDSPFLTHFGQKIVKCLNEGERK